MIDFERANEILDINKIECNKIYYIDVYKKENNKEQELEYSVFYNNPANYSAEDLLNLTTYFVDSKKVGIFVYGMILVWGTYQITYQYIPEIIVPHKEIFKFSDQMGNDIIIEHTTDKDILFNISVQYGITENVLNLIRSWHKTYNSYIKENVHEFVVKRYEYKS